ncbi:hypothetical protein RRG08_050238 [Elysia crispata]|uniref:EF-hand domain-containing protein n=1 Tax=Elysia crispata TaxID=231223 RepID=A0AAE1B3Q5_9GAST|nr:hypothetical protein RRG08_050238 [Elysia crispata]
MAAPAVASAVEENIRTVAQTKRIRVNEFFQDYDKLRSGFVSAPQFFRCLWQTLSLKLNEDEERALCLKYGLLDNGKINYKRFCDVIDLNFDPKNIYASPESQKVVPLEYLGTIRSKRPLTVDSESRLVGILRRMQQFYNVRGINLRTQYEDFDRHHKGVVSESQFYRNFPGPIDIDEEDMKTLVEKYNDPNNPGLVNYLNLHHDVLAVHKFVLAEKDPRQTFVNRDVDMVSLFPAKDPTLAEILDKIRVSVYKNGIRTIEFFKDHDKLRSGVITENQFVCGLALACGKEAQLSRQEIQKVVEYYRLPDGRIQYKEFCDAMENAFNIPDLEKKPTESVQRPLRGTLSRGLKPLTETEEQRLHEVINTIADKVATDRIMIYQYFKDYDRSRAYTRVVTPTQFARILHFLGLNVNNQDLLLLLNKFQDPASGDVNYPAFVQAVDREFVGHTIDDADISDQNRTNVVIQAKEDKWVESPPVMFEELMARIRHIALANRLRVNEYFQDYDSLRSGSISIPQFRRGLAVMGLSKLGHHDLNDNQFKQLIDNYCNPAKSDQVLWTKFCADVESVFTQEQLELAPMAQVPRQEIFRVPKPGTTDWGNASKDHVDLYNETMNRIRQRVEHRRILCKPVFQDFDRHNNGHITRTQFRQAFKILEIPVEEPEFHCLEALYCNDVGVCYTAFLADLEPQEPVPFMYVKRMEELRLTNCKQALPEQRAKTDLESVFLKIKTKVCKERLRVYEFMKDYDKLRSGRMLKTSFRRALNLARLDLLESEVAMLEDKYQSGCDPDFVEYLRFCQEIESIFTKDHLEKSPLEDVEQFRPDEEWTVTELTSDEEEKLYCCLLRIAEKVRKHQMQLFPLFEDYDRVHNGAVSQSQFRRVLMELELASLASDTDVKLIWRKYQMQVGGRTDVNYIAFCEKVCELAGFEYRKP